MKIDEKNRMVFGDFVDKVFWLVISGFLFWIAMSITALNEKIAVIVTQISYESKVNAEHETRLKELEREITRLQSSLRK
jgi:hypothetical protein